MYRKESTTELEKNTEEIGEIHKVMMRELGEKFYIEYHDFPHDPEKWEEPPPPPEYPDNYKEPKF